MLSSYLLIRRLLGSLDFGRRNYEASHQFRAGNGRLGVYVIRFVVPPAVATAVAS